MRFPLLLAALTLLVSCAALKAPAATAPSPAAPATLVLRGGRIVTVDPARPEARALAARGDTIVAVGSEEEIAPLIGSGTEVIELGGRLAIPGFIDSHAHFMGIGETKLGLDLTKATSWEEIVALVASAVKASRPGRWIVGRGWHQSKWARVPEPNVEGFPLHGSLSRVSPDNPVLLVHASGHASFANARAMSAAGITKETRSAPGGEILKTASGELVGLFRETADEPLQKAYEKALASRSPKEREADERRIVQLATEECLAKGVTSLHDAGVSFETARLYRTLATEGALGVRLYAMLREGPKALAARLPREKVIGLGGGFLTIRSIKVSIDGALGTRSAWLLEPYADLSTSTGLNTTPLDDLRETVRLALASGFQVCVHAIGDRANREVLDIYEQAFRGRAGTRELRFRVEHAQHLSTADIPRFGALGVVAAMQGIHCTSDAPYVPARLGARRTEEGAYVWQKLLKSGAVVANGTDAPVEDVDPIASFHASVSRKTKDGSVFFGDQRMSRLEALRSTTWAGAFAAFEEDTKGSLAVGKLADVVVLSKDILQVPEDEIPAAKVVTTIVGGKVRYRARP